MLHFNFVLISIKSFRSCNTISLDDYFTCSTIPIRSICIGDRYFSFCSKYLIFRTICLVKTNIKRCMHTIWKRSEEHTSELQSRFDLVCRLLLEKKKIAENREETKKDIAAVHIYH